MYPLAIREDEMRAEFLLLILLSVPFTRFAVDCSLRAAIPKINREALGEGWLWYPDLSTQDAILRQTEELVEPVDRAINRARQEIELLGEYRTRLIADLVTGKLDVRGAAASLAEVDPADLQDTIEIDGVVAAELNAELEEGRYVTTDTSERGLERLICRGDDGRGSLLPAGGVAETPATYGERRWVEGSPNDYDREHAIDLVQLTAFLHATQPEVAEAIDLANHGPTRLSFLARLQGEITRRGTIDVLRSGLKHRQHNLDLFYGTPSPGNPTAAERFALNRFTVTRQLRYSKG